MKLVIPIIFITSLFAQIDIPVNIPKEFKTTINNIEVKKIIDNKQLTKSNNIFIKDKKKDVYTSRSIDIGKKESMKIYKLPYKSLQNYGDKVVVIGNVIKVYRDNKIEVISKNRFIDRISKINSYIDEFIDALSRLKKDKKEYIDCGSLFGYYKEKNSCITLFNMLNREDKKNMNRFIKHFMNR